eukprot:6171975-Pleurochrysis_carterae.AAC.2
MFAHLPSRLCARLIHRRRAYSSSVSAAEQPAGVKGLFGDGESISSTALDLLQFGAFVAMVNRFFVTITQCTGPSMLPTIGTSGDIFLTIPLRIPQWLGIERPRVGDVVIAISPTDPTQTVCKRVLGARLSHDLSSLIFPRPPRGTDQAIAERTLFALT